MEPGSLGARIRPWMTRKNLEALIIVGGLAGTLLGLASIRAIRHGIYDFDEFWHLATGRIIVESGVVPTRDPFTFASGDADWINSNWLAQVFLWKIFARWSIEGDWLLGVALIFGACVFTLDQALRRVRSPWAAVPIVFMTLSILQTGSTVRPQGWTFFLLALEMALLERLREKVTLGRTAVLAALLVFGEQLHGGYLFLYAVAGLEAAAEVADVVWGRRGATLERALALGVVLVSGLGGFALHPHGFKALWHPIAYISDPRIRGIFSTVLELAPPNLTQGPGLLTERAVLLLLAACMLGRRPFRFSEVLITLIFLHWSLTTLRGNHYFICACGGTIAYAIDGVFDLARRRAPARVRAIVRWIDGREEHARTFVWIVPAVFVVAFVGTARDFSPRLKPGIMGDFSSPLFEEHRGIADIASFVATTNPPGRMYNAMHYGGPLLWGLFPARKVFIDGRGDFHALTGVYQAAFTIQGVNPGWEQILDGYQLDLAVAPRLDLLDRALRGRGWRVAHENPEFSLLVRPGSESERRLLDPAH